MTLKRYPRVNKILDAKKQLANAMSLYFKYAKDEKNIIPYSILFYKHLFKVRITSGSSPFTGSILLVNTRKIMTEKMFAAIINP